MQPTVQTATRCCNIVAPVDELGEDTPADDSNDEYYKSFKTELSMTWKLAHFATTVSQMKSTAKHVPIVTHPVDDVCY